MTDFSETAVEIARVTEGHYSEKMILRFLICSMYYHGLICIKPHCKLNKYLDVVNKTLLSDLPAEQKVEKFQNESRFYYQEFSKLHFYLKSLAGQVRKEIGEEKK